MKDAKVGVWAGRMIKGLVVVIKKSFAKNPEKVIILACKTI